MKSTLFAIMAVTAIVLAGVAGPARAQTHEDVRIAIERTDELIAKGQEIVGGSGNVQASAELALAVDLQASAKVEFNALHDLRALDLTRRARLHVEKAIALINGLPDPDRVLVQLERTRELLDRARERMGDCELDRARAMLRTAVEMQDRAEMAARDGRYLGALRLTMSARERALRALRLCNLEDNQHDATERALARTDELIARTRDLLAEHENDAARQALNRAVELEAEGWTQFRAGHFEASLTATQSARTFAHRAMRLAGAH